VFLSTDTIKERTVNGEKLIFSGRKDP